MSKATDKWLNDLEKTVEQLNPEQSIKTFESIKAYLMEQTRLGRTIIREEEKARVRVK